MIYYQYRAERARRTLHGIDEQVAKAQRAVDGQAPVKRNRFIRLIASAAVSVVGGTGSARLRKEIMAVSWHATAWAGTGPGRELADIVAQFA